MRRVQYKFAGNTNSRRDKRQSAPILRLNVAGHEFATADWSLGGVRLYGIPEGAELDGQVKVNFTGQRSGGTWSGKATAIYVWIDQVNAESGLRFTDLPDASFDALETLVTGISRRPV